MDVPSYATLTNDCTDAPAWNFGTVLPGTDALTATDANLADAGHVCHLEFSSSSDTTMLHMFQTDRVGTAMGAPSTAVAQRERGPVFDAASILPDGSVGYVVGDHSRMSRYAAGTWGPVIDAGLGNISPAAVAAIDANKVVMVGKKQTPWYSANGSATAPSWTEVDGPLNWTNNATALASADDGTNKLVYAVGGSVIPASPPSPLPLGTDQVGISTDGGVTWANATDGLGTGDWIKSVTAAPGTDTAFAHDCTDKSDHG